MATLGLVAIHESSGVATVDLTIRNLPHTSSNCARTTVDGHGFIGPSP